MRTIFRIARLELSTLFFSPVAWLILLIFLVQSGLWYTDYVAALESSHRLNSDIPGSLTQSAFGGMYGFFSNVQRNLYLYLPLLTMGLLSREYSSGSIKLVLSSPVSISEIVFGKFFAMMCYGLMLVFVLFLFALSAYFVIGHLDMKFILSGLLGLFLLICAYSAIGLFMSSLTSYQIVSAISTMVVFAALYYVGQIWQNIDFVRDLTYWLSLNFRTYFMLDGLIGSKDVIYFILVVLLFNGLTILKLKGDGESAAPMLKTMRYVALVVCVLMAGYLTSRPSVSFYYDTSRNKSRTLTPNTQAVLKQLQDQPVKITNYVNILDLTSGYGMPDNWNNERTFFQGYQRFLPDMEWEYVYYYDTPSDTYLTGNNPQLTLKQLAAKVAETRDFDTARLLSPEQIRQKIDLRAEDNRFVRVLQYGDKKSILRVIDKSGYQPGESVIAASFKHLTMPAPKIGFLTGENERGTTHDTENDYKFAFDTKTNWGALVNDGFKMESLDLSNADVPEDITVLVIADPQAALSADKLDRISRYIARGGNLLIAAEAARKQYTAPLLEMFGVQLGDSVLLQNDKNFLPDFIKAEFADSAAAVSGDFKGQLQRKEHVNMPGVAKLYYDADHGYKVYPLLKAGEPVALALTRQVKSKAQKIMIFGDADFMSTKEITRFESNAENYYTVPNIFGWFADQQFPINVEREKSIDLEVIIDKYGVRRLKWLFLGIFPALLFLAGSWLLIYRKRK